jgi:glyoxylase-like metal-dependent hydrolase (beta-lactamase superfamily II)
VVKKMEGSVDNLKVIYVGTSYRGYGEWSVVSPHEKHFRRFNKVLEQIGVKTSSTVTYVKSDGQDILIDTGDEYSMTKTPEKLRTKNRVVHNLRFHEIEPEDIDEIFITHWHWDHTGNIPCFPNARILYAGVTSGFVKKRLANYKVANEFSQINETDKWHTGMEIIPTPGHAGLSDHSVAIRFQRKIFVVTGDTIVSRSFYHNRAFWPNEYMEKNLAQLRSSYDKIVELADVIIPGHDVPFNNYLKPS